MKYIIVAAIWAGYGILHSVLISEWFTNGAKRLLGRFYAFYRLAYNLLAMILFASAFQYSKALDSQLIIHFVTPWTLLQNVLLLGSVIVMLWAFLSYDPLEFIGLRQILSAFGQKESRPISYPKTLTKKGLLGIVRHPMYTATIIFIWSLNATRMDLLVHLIFTLYILFGIRFEERKLVREFGEEYTTYQKEVPALVPFIRL